MESGSIALYVHSAGRSGLFHLKSRHYFFGEPFDLLEDDLRGCRYHGLDVDLPQTGIEVLKQHQRLDYLLRSAAQEVPRSDIIFNGG